MKSVEINLGQVKETLFLLWIYISKAILYLSDRTAACWDALCSLLFVLYAATSLCHSINIRDTGGHCDWLKKATRSFLQH
jgi:hypothetical protein